MTTQVSLGFYASAGVGVAALLLGITLTKYVPFLKRFCIPSPVSGGLIVSLVTLLLYSVFGIECQFDGSMKDLCMMLFFTSVGFQSDMRALRKGGKPLLVMIGLVALLIIAQNLISVGIAHGMSQNSLFGMATGSIPMCGGHGTAGGFSPLLEQMGLTGASSITMAAATFGLVAGSLLGFPAGRPAGRSPRSPEKTGDTVRDILIGACILLVTIALGTGLSRLPAGPEPNCLHHHWRIRLFLPLGYPRDVSPGKARAQRLVPGESQAPCLL